jgi:hypothetical protein
MQKFMVYVETVKESRKYWSFHFDLQLVPIVLELTFVYCQEAQNFQLVE